MPAGNETDPSSTYGRDKVYLINPLLEPIISTTFELGTKHLIALQKRSAKSLTYDLAFYYINLQNDIIPTAGKILFYRRKD